MEINRYYQVLEIESGASQAEIKQAYRDLILVWHPDRFTDNLRLQQKAEEKVKQLNAAYEFLKSYQPQSPPNPVNCEQKQSKQKQPVKVSVNCEKLKQLLELGKLKEADQETKRLLLELAGRVKDGWLRSEDVKAFASHDLAAIDQLWTQYSNGRFGLSVQREIWQKLSCKSSVSIPEQTISENKFGQFVHWRTGSLWLSPWDSFNYDHHAPLGSLPREYIFTLPGWCNYSKGWSGYLLWRFDEIILKL